MIAKKIPLSTSELSPAGLKVYHDLNSSIKMRIFLLAKIPSAFFTGIRVSGCTLEEGTVSVPYSWFSQNPFKSIYFAAQCAAAELSTGILARMGVAHFGSTSMLVTNIEGRFTKKATSKTIFTCSEGTKILEALHQTHQTGEGVQIRVETVGVQATGEEVARFWITWSFKARSTGNG